MSAKEFTQNRNRLELPACCITSGKTPSGVRMKRQAFWMLVSRGGGSLCQAILFVLLARSTSTVAFGGVNATMGVAVFLGVLADLGLSTYIVRAYAIDENFSKVESALQLNRISTITFAVVLSVVFLSAAAPLALNPWLVLVVWWIAIEKNVEAQLGVFIARTEVFAPSLSIALRRVVPLLLFVVFDQFGLSPEIGFGLCLMVGVLLGQAHMTLALRALRVGWVPVPVGRRLIIREALPYSLTNIASQARNLDTPIVSLVASTAAAGFFAASSKASIPIFLVAGAIATAVMPAVANGGKQFSNRLMWYLLVGLGISCGASLLVLPWSDWLMQQIYGAEYAHTGALFILVVLGTIFAAVTSPLSALAQSHGEARSTATVGLVFAVLLLLAIGIGGVIGGVFGAAWGALVVQAARCGVMVMIVRVAIARA